MKNLFTFVFTLMVVNAFAQISCGTIPSPEFLDYYLSKDMSYLNETGSRDVNAIIYVPIQYHIVGTDAGTGYYPVKDLLAVHCQLNQRYSHAQIQFYMYNAPHYIKSTRFYTMSDNSVDRDMKTANNVTDVCNVYIVQDAISSGTTVCGYATFPGFGRQGIVVAKNCSNATSTTLAHEMGHFLGLPHTFSGWEGRDPTTAAATNNDEKVNGSNCATKGDRFCDTPADFYSDRWSCPYTGSKTDINGDLYRTVLDGGYFMSYSNDACQTKFSPLQEAEMNNVRRTSRVAMDAFIVPSTIDPASTTLVSPIAAVTGIAPFSSLIWNKSVDATHYHLLMSTSSSFNFNVIVDTILTDTTYKLYKAVTNTTYYWKVLPMTLAASCGTYTPTSSFTTSNLNAEVVLTPITCPGGIDGAINLSPSGGTPPYTYLWSNGDAFNVITDLGANNYTVTVTDLLSRVMIATITVPDGPLININIYPTATNQITADASGGNGAPYTYSWSNGVTTPQSSPNVGNVTVTVTDARGCSNSRTISYNGISDYDKYDQTISVFPNPVVNSDVSLNIIANEPGDATIKIFTMNGELLFEKNEQLIDGDNTFMLPTNKFTKGVYVVQVNELNITKNIRLIIQ